MAGLATRDPAVPPVGTDGARHMQVWIDQDLCTGDGICADACPEVFVIQDDGIAYVREGEQLRNVPGGPSQPAGVAPEHEEAVIWSAQHCPGECIFVEAAA